MDRINVKNIIILSFAAIFTFCCKAQYNIEGNKMNTPEKYNIKIITGDKIISAVLENNSTVRDLISMLPLEVELKDYAGTEKITYLPGKLSVKDAPSGCDPSIGDITYYAPWGNIAIFYKDFGYAEGLIKLGKITGGIELLNSPSPIKARIELDEE